MRRNGSQMLLKYDIQEQKTVADNNIVLKERVKILFRCFLLMTLISFLLLFYAPVYFQVTVDKKTVDASVYGWGLNTSRSIPLYILPDNDTALIVNNKLCSEPLPLLIIVCSAVNNTLERLTIRETWGNFSSPSYKISFLLGTTENVTLQVLTVRGNDSLVDVVAVHDVKGDKAFSEFQNLCERSHLYLWEECIVHYLVLMTEGIEEESRTYNDIIQEDFIDSYNNLTLKSVMLLKYIKNHCDKVSFVLKSDDDMFVHVQNLISLISKISEKEYKDVLVGELICNAKPIHNKRSKWYSPKYMYREKVYPHYLSGTGYLMDRKTAVSLYEAALTTPFFHLEDVYITGLCAKKAGVRPRHHSGFSYQTRPLDPCLYIKNRNIITSHRVTLDNMRHLWTGLQNGTNCLNATTTSIPKLLKMIKLSSYKKNRCF